MINSNLLPDNPLPSYCELEYQISERLSQNLLRLTKNTQLKMLAILTECKVTSEPEPLNESYDLAGIIVTDDHLYVTQPKYGWLMEKLDLNVQIAQAQLMTNLVDVTDIAENSFTLCFLDEISDRHDRWKCTFETKSSAESTFNTIEQSWQKFFHVPLAN